MRGTGDILAAKHAADTASALLDHKELLRDIGVGFDEAEFLASQVADDYYSMLSEQLIIEDNAWRAAIRIQLRAAWLGGCVVGGHMEGATDDEYLLGYEELHEAAEELHADNNTLPNDGSMRAINLDKQATWDAASDVGLSVLPILLAHNDCPQLTDDDEVNCGAAIAGTWMDGLVISVQARQKARSQQDH